MPHPSRFPDVFFLCFLSLVATLAHAQDRKAARDSVLQMEDIMVKGFETKSGRKMVPASVGMVGQRDFDRTPGTSLLPSVNTLPGVRMEERSPGSYRFSVRGSLLRSPFGVRNVKVYWNDLPFTDAGGNTYLNLVDLHALSSVEVLKGPAGSLYGANTGGVVVLHPGSASISQDSLAHGDHFTLGVSGGSYGSFNEHAIWRTQRKNFSLQITQAHQQADGYRVNSKLRRDILQADARYRTGVRNELSGLLLLADLQYRTPGGLTLAQMTKDPRQARPATPTIPSASAQQAGVFNQSLVAGVSDAFSFAPGWELDLSTLVSVTGFRNPFLTNYEKRQEENLAFRGKIRREGHLGSTSYQWITGGEWVRGWYRIDSTGNQGGQPDAHLVRDRVNAVQGFLFTQFEWRPSSIFLVQAGISMNRFRYDLERIVGQPATGKVPVDFKTQWVPRLSALLHPGQTWSLHASVSKGYSPPSIAEVRPAAGGFDTGLQAEYGWNYEAGLHLSFIHNRIQTELTAFQFDLKQAIVPRTDASGAQYFINSGGTRQSGLETMIEAWPLLKPNASGLSSLKLWTSITISDFTFRDYKSGNADFSGHVLTGVPHDLIISGLDISFLHHFTFHATHTYTGKIYLTDANDASAPSFNLMQFRAGWKGRVDRLQMEFYAGVDNAGDVLYSLGHDLNAFGKRYYNPAPGRNFYVGTVVRF